MTAYEVSDLLNGVMSNQLASAAFFITVVSAYLVAAYTVGEKLTKFQVWFINFTFCLIVVTNLTGSASFMGLIYQYDSIRAELISGVERIAPDTINLALWLVVGVRLVLVAGGLIFMWQVRHPKTI